MQLSRQYSGAVVVVYWPIPIRATSGPLPGPVADAVNDGSLVACSVLSGNRNFERRVNPLVKANYLASPPQVVAYAIAGTVRVNLYEDPLGEYRDGNPVYRWTSGPATRR